MVEFLGQVSKYTNLVAIFYVYLFLLVFCLGYWLLNQRSSVPTIASVRGIIAAPLALGMVVILASMTNLRTIQADVTFKLGEPFAQRTDTLPAAIAIYNQANQLAPFEDYYYLFLGRAYLDSARTINQSSDRDVLMQKAAVDLKKAQELNPLNTDHTANLARLYSLWALSGSDSQVRSERATTSDDYFARAVNLSPNNVRIRNEWAYLKMQILNQPDQANEQLQLAMKIDPSYDWTYGQLGDYYLGQALNMTDPAGQQQTLEKAVEYYNQALTKSSDARLKYSYLLNLAVTQAQLGNFDLALAAYQEALQSAPVGQNTWRVSEAIAKLFYQLGDKVRALIHAQQALSDAPDDQKEILQGLIDQINSP